VLSGYLNDLVTLITNKSVENGSPSSDITPLGMVVILVSEAY
jgi:hypothetical protein